MILCSEIKAARDSPLNPQPQTSPLFHIPENRGMDFRTLSLPLSHYRVVSVTSVGFRVCFEPLLVNPLALQ